MHGDCLNQSTTIGTQHATIRLAVAYPIFLSDLNNVSATLVFNYGKSLNILNEKGTDLTNAKENTTDRGIARASLMEAGSHDHATSFVGSLNLLWLLQFVL